MAQAGFRKTRRRQPRPLKTRVLIVCEGRETEPSYFDGLKRRDEVRARFAVTVKRGRGGSREQVARHAVDLKSGPYGDFDEVWCVLDAEEPEQRDSLDRALAMLDENDIVACLSNPAFEVWLLAHFERTGTPFLGCDQVVVRLNPHWKRRSGRDYDKSDREIYHLVAPLTDDAVGNAKWVRETHHDPKQPTADCNSSTDVYHLVGKLVGGSAASKLAG